MHFEIEICNILLMQITKWGIANSRCYCIYKHDYRMDLICNHAGVYNCIVFSITNFADKIFINIKFISLFIT